MIITFVIYLVPIRNIFIMYYIDDLLNITEIIFHAEKMILSSISSHLVNLSIDLFFIVHDPYLIGFFYVFDNFIF